MMRGEGELISKRYTVTTDHNDFRIELSSDASYVTVSLTVQGSHETVSINNHNL